MDSLLTGHLSCLCVWLMATGCAQLSGVSGLSYDREQQEASVDATTPPASDASDEATDTFDAIDANDTADTSDATDATQPPDALQEADVATKPLPVLRETRFHCKLINGNSETDPSANNTHDRANIRGTNLGISVKHDNDLYFFFGDTAGAYTIWPPNNSSLGEAVGYSQTGFANTAADPDALCSNLRFLVKTTGTGSATADFFPAQMQPPTGHDIGEFIKQPGRDGFQTYPNIPGTLEVPTGAFSYNGAIFVFYTIVRKIDNGVTASYVAKWQAPSTTGEPRYQILYHLDSRDTTPAPMGGNYINIAALQQGDFVYLYGTGKYRQSPVHLARKLVTSFDTPDGFEFYDAKNASWNKNATDTSPVVSTPNVGELSVQYYPNIDRYAMMYQQMSLDGQQNLIVARFSPSPEGPWSNPITVASMTDKDFVKSHCCLSSICEGQKFIECNKTGFFGTYLLPSAVVHSDESFTLVFTMSTYIPNNIVLMGATFH